MDPGQKLLNHLKTVPNLVNEDPSIITPKNTSFVDVPWEDFSAMLQQKRKDNAEICKKCATPPQENGDVTCTHPEYGSVEDFTLGNWDASTGYQDVGHRKTTSS